MSLFSTPEEHADNPPSTWLTSKAGRSSWKITLKDGATTLDQFPTKKAADQARIDGWFTLLYAKETRWYAGETPPGYRSWAACKADQEASAARQSAPKPESGS